MLVLRRQQLRRASPIRLWEMPLSASIMKRQEVLQHLFRRLCLWIVANTFEQHGIGVRNQLPITRDHVRTEMGSTAPSITCSGTPPFCMAATQRSRCWRRSGM